MNILSCNIVIEVANIGKIVQLRRLSIMSSNEEWIYEHETNIKDGSVDETYSDSYTAPVGL